MVILSLHLYPNHAGWVRMRWLGTITYHANSTNYTLDDAQSSLQGSSAVVWPPGPRGHTVRILKGTAIATNGTSQNITQGTLFLCARFVVRSVKHLQNWENFCNGMHRSTASRTPTRRRSLPPPGPEITVAFWVFPSVTTSEISLFQEKFLEEYSTDITGTASIVGKNVTVCSQCGRCGVCDVLWEECLYKCVPPTPCLIVTMTMCKHL